ncbi:pyridoxamine 5'-phosphate oxidase family protein [Luteococcus peritonei]|uniref:Pyridoxamine 5'-phosphate oxidase family protein n=1 Tax=Luteococcus peritonei TaxID=88874 RepID=A0ABW4RT24_9ACTN
MGDGHFENLDAAECTQLLRSATVGRVAFQGPDGLTVLPLAYSVDGDRVVLRTASGTQLAKLAEGTEVAFEVDEFDAECSNGWSVLVRGALAKLTPGELDGEVAPPTPFVPGVRRVLLGLSLERLSGRAVSGDQ